MTAEMKLLLLFRKAVCAVIGHRLREPFAFFDGESYHVPLYHPEQVALVDAMNAINSKKYPVVEVDVPRDALMCARCVQVRYRWASFPRSTK